MVSKPATRPAPRAPSTRRRVPVPRPTDHREIALGIGLTATALLNLENKLRRIAGKNGTIVDALASLKGDEFPTACIDAVRAFLKAGPIERNAKGVAGTLVWVAWRVVAHDAYGKYALTPEAAIREANRCRDLYGDPPTTARAIEIERLLQNSTETKATRRSVVSRVYTLIARGSSAPWQGEAEAVDDDGRRRGRRGAGRGELARMIAQQDPNPERDIGSDRVVTAGSVDQVHGRQAISAPERDVSLGGGASGGRRDPAQNRPPRSRT